MKRLESEFLPWDSSFFGFPVGRIRLDDLVVSVRLSDIMNALGYFRLCYLFSAGRADNDVQAFEDERIVFEMTDNGHLKKLPEALASVDESEYTKLEGLALEAGAYSRFKLDTALPSDTYERLYRLWLNRSLSREIADEVYVISTDAKASGFVTLKKANELMEIGLIAVRPEFRGKGLGSQLIEASSSYAKGAGCNRLRVATQRRNSAACEFYRRCGFTEVSSQFIYHVWNQDPVQ